MKLKVHKAENRGHANYGWLDTWYSFSFANYFNPEKINFGCLRVLNDDFIDGGMGFDLHPHENMEIITIIHEGALEHTDSMGNKGIIRKNEVQVMTAGTGIYHSEKNAHASEPVKLFQIWIIPQKKSLSPSYDQRLFDPIHRNNLWQYLVSPDNEASLSISQDAWIAMVDMDKSSEITYNVHNSRHGVFVMVVEGIARIGETVLNKRDAVCITDANDINILSDFKTTIMVIEIPMNL